MPVSNEVCSYAGCTTPAVGRFGFCAVHHRAAYPCAVAGCKNEVAAYSRSRCCNEHKCMGAMRLRKGIKPWE